VKRIFFALTLVGLTALSASAQLTLADVEQVIARATTRAIQILLNSVIAVTDREGYVLGVWERQRDHARHERFPPHKFGSRCSGEGRHGGVSFLSSDQKRFPTTRTAGFIVQTALSARRPKTNRLAPWWA